MPAGVTVSARFDGSEQVCVALASRTVHNVAFPDVMMTFPAGLPEKCGTTATVILTDVSCPYFTDAGDKVRVVREVARRTVSVASPPRRRCRRHWWR